MGRKKKEIKDVTIIDVAKEAKVSHATVSRVINDRNNVRPATRERVLAAMDKLGYQVNVQARTLAGGRSKVIGLLVHGLGNPYTGEVTSGIDEACNEANYNMMLYTTHRQISKEVDFVNFMVKGTCDGLLIVLPQSPDRYLTHLRKSGLPYVLVDHRGEDERDASIICNNVKGAYKAVEHLLQLGHRRIACISGTSESHSTQERLQGYRQALTEYGITVDPSLIVDGDFMQLGGFQAMSHLLDNVTPRPTAVFALSDLMALGCLDAARERGLKVPDDLSVVGFDDIPQAGYLRPPLTTVHQPMVEMGRFATRMLLDYIAQPDLLPQKVELPTKLIVRATTQQLNP